MVVPGRDRPAGEPHLPHHACRRHGAGHARLRGGSLLLSAHARSKRGGARPGRSCCWPSPALPSPGRSGVYCGRGGGSASPSRSCARQRNDETEDHPHEHGDDCRPRGRPARRPCRTTCTTATGTPRTGGTMTSTGLDPGGAAGQAMRPTRQRRAVVDAMGSLTTSRSAQGDPNDLLRPAWRPGRTRADRSPDPAAARRDAGEVDDRAVHRGRRGDLPAGVRQPPPPPGLPRVAARRRSRADRERGTCAIAAEHGSDDVSHTPRSSDLRGPPVPTASVSRPVSRGRGRRGCVRLTRAWSSRETTYWLSWASRNALGELERRGREEEGAECQETPWGHGRWAGVRIATSMVRSASPEGRPTARRRRVRSGGGCPVVHAPSQPCGTTRASARVPDRQVRDCRIVSSWSPAA